MSLNNKDYKTLTEEQVDFLSVNFSVVSFSIGHRPGSAYIHLKAANNGLGGRPMPEAIVVRSNEDSTIPGGVQNMQLVYSNAEFEAFFLQAGLRLSE
jgi:hypothetical protein